MLTPTMVQSEDACKSWLLERACKGLAVPESLCEALLSEDQALIDLSTFLKGLFASPAAIRARLGLIQNTGILPCRIRFGSPCVP